MNNWTIPDLADLEYFLALDGTAPDAAATERDRHIFHAAIAPGMPDFALNATSSRRRALRIWLEERRKIHAAQAPGAALPGGLLAESLGIMRILTGLTGLISGAGLAFSLLNYSGKAAVNVSLYLGVLVFFQIFTLLIMLRFFYFKASINSLRQHSLLYGGLIRMMEKISIRAMRGALARMEGRHRDGLRAAAGHLHGIYGVYNTVLFWTLFGVVQLFGVLFNLGAIGASLARVFAADLAFGWQSTVQMSAQSVHALVKIMATPWSWLLGPHAYPSLEQIEGSRMILKEGIHTLATGNLVSWWPFLIAAVVFYGLLPRMSLALLASFNEQRALNQLRFTHVGCEALLLRMSAPGLSTQGAPDQPGLTPQRLEKNPERPAPGFLTNIDTLALVPEEIAHGFDQDAINRVLGARMGWQISARLNITGETGHDLPVMAPKVKEYAAQEGAVLLVQEAWLPPIAETTGLIRELRALGGRLMPIAVLLIGKPAAGTILTPARPQDMAIWNKALAALADPYLSINTLKQA